MAALVLPKFKGPATAGAVSDWFQACETAFSRHERRTSTKLLDDEKISECGAAFAEDNEMEDEKSKGLKRWYSRNWQQLEEGTWDEFRDKLKDHLLGAEWKLFVLRDFFTYSQGVETLEGYFDVFRDHWNSLWRSSQLPNVDRKVLNCLLVFRTLPDIYTGFVNDTFNAKNVLEASESELLRALQKHEAHSSGVPGMHYREFCAATDTPYLASRMFSLNGPRIAHTGAIYHHSAIDSLPEILKDLGRMSRIEIHRNNNSRIMMALRFVTFFSYNDFTSSMGSGTHNDVKVTMEISEGDYLKSVTFSRDTFETGTSTGTRPDGLAWSMALFPGDADGNSGCFPIGMWM